MKLRFLLLFFVLWWPMAGRASPDMPASMVLEGTLAPGDVVSSTSPGVQDRVLAFSLSDGQLVGSGVIGIRTYAIILSRTVSFNGMQAVLELQQGRKRFALMLTNGSPAILRFAGRTLPERTMLPLKVGELTAELTEAEASNPQAQRLSLRTDLPCSTEADVNHDGVCDEKDLQILRLFAGGTTRTVGQP